jgi:hypothetical protein
MNAMAHAIPNTLGANQKGVEEKIRKLLPSFLYVDTIFFKF